jgi:endoglucanase
MRYNDPSKQPMSGSVIGNTSDPHAATTANIADLWAQLACRFKHNPNIIFGIMNEPHDMPTSLVLKNNQAMVDAIRGVGAQQLILVPGNGWTGAHRWLENSCEAAECAPNAEVMRAIYDPLDNFAFDMHLYFDNDTSGTHPACTLSAPANLGPVTKWLHENRHTAFLSEFGAGQGENCSETLRNTLMHLEHSGVFIGWTYWSAGPIYGDYFLSVEPDEGVQANSTWPDVLEPAAKRLRGLRKSGLSTNGKKKYGQGGGKRQ